MVGLMCEQVWILGLVSVSDRWNIRNSHFLRYAMAMAKVSGAWPVINVALEDLVELVAHF